MLSCVSYIRVLVVLLLYLANTEYSSSNQKEPTHRWSDNHFPACRCSRVVAGVMLRLSTTLALLVDRLLILVSGAFRIATSKQKEPPEADGATL